MEAMKYRLFMLLMLLATKTRYLTKGLRRRLKMMENMANVRLEGDARVDVSGTIIRTKPNLPVNVSDIISNIQNSRDFMPLLISLGWLPDIDNPEEALEMLYEQKEREAKINQSAFSHSDDDRDVDDDLEDDIEDEEDE